MNNIKISGIPVCPKENLNDITVKIFKAFDVELSVGDIDTAHRLPAMDKSQAPAAVVRLLSRNKRNDLLDRIHATRKRITSLDIGVSGTISQ